MRLLHAIYFAPLIPVLAFGQSTDSPKSSDTEKQFSAVAGEVLRLDTGEPLKKAQVTLHSHAGDGFSAYRVTDDQGRFSIENIPTGAYRLEVSRNGFVDNEYGQKKSGRSGAILTLSPGQHLTDLVFKMTRSAAISGHVYDEDGEPIPHAEVMCYRASRLQGKEERTDNYQPVATNDLGEFRIFDLRPGRYYVVAIYHLSLNVGFRMGNLHREVESSYPSTYYPNTTDPAKAIAIAVNGGDEIQAIDFQIRPARFVTVSGRVTNTVPAPPHTTAEVYLVSRASGLAEAKQSLYDSTDLKDGQFAIHNVPPGLYTLSASWTDRGVPERYSGRRSLEVGNTDLDGVVVTIAPGVNVSGRVVWEGSPTVDTQELAVWLHNVDENFPYYRQQLPKADGSFVLKNITEGTYRPRVDMQRMQQDTFYMKSARYGTLSVSDSGFTVQPGGDLRLEITLSSRTAQVNGTVLTSDSFPASGVTVVLIPEAARRSLREYYRYATTDQNGRFSIKGITPGDYKLFSWDSEGGNEWSDSEWYDAAWLRPYETKGESIHVDESDNKSVNLTLIETKSDSPAAN